MPLALTGLFTNLGLFAHLVIIWAGPIGVQVKGLFYGAPYHDVPALIAFLTILVTTVNFVVSVEVNFYPRYRACSTTVVWWATLWWPRRKCLPRSTENCGFVRSSNCL